jgi:hypothetical protein
MSYFQVPPPPGFCLVYRVQHGRLPPNAPNRHSLVIAASPLQTASPGSAHCYIEYSAIMSIADRSIVCAKLRTEGKPEQNRVAAVCRGEAAVTSDCTALQVDLPELRNIYLVFHASFLGPYRSTRTILHPDVPIVDTIHKYGNNVCDVVVASCLGVMLTEARSDWTRACAKRDRGERRMRTGRRAQTASCKCMRLYSH